MAIQREFGELVEDLLSEDLRVRVTEFAQLIGYDQSFISKLIRGSRRPKEHHLKAIELVLDKMYRSRKGHALPEDKRTALQAAFRYTRSRHHFAIHTTS